MALDITISGKYQYQEGFHLRWYADGFYTHIYEDLLELEKLTNQKIGLYNDSEFRSDNLPVLKYFLIQLIDKTNIVEKDSWQVLIGTEYGLVVREIYETIQKSQLLTELKKFLVLVDTAIENNEYIICSGD